MEKLSPGKKRKRWKRFVFFNIFSHHAITTDMMEIFFKTSNLISLQVIKRKQGFENCIKFDLYRYGREERQGQLPKQFKTSIIYFTTIRGFEAKLELYYDYIISFLFTHSSDPKAICLLPPTFSPKSSSVSYYWALLSSYYVTSLQCLTLLPTSSLFSYSCHNSFLLIFHISLRIYLNLLFFPVFLPFKCLNSVFSPFLFA